MLNKPNEKTLSEKALESHDSITSIFESVEFVPSEDTVVLTQAEIDAAKKNKRDMRKKAKTFVNAPIYRSFHTTTSLLMQIITLMPKKTVKLSDVMLVKLNDAITWTASAYEQIDPMHKHYLLCEAISLMYSIKVYANSASSLNLIGKSKSTQLSKAIDAILRQLVAWRGSLIDKGDNACDE